MLSKDEQAQRKARILRENIARVAPCFRGECECDHGVCVASKFTYAEAIGYSPDNVALDDCWDDLVARGLAGDDCF